MCLPAVRGPRPPIHPCAAQPPCMPALPLPLALGRLTQLASLLLPSPLQGCCTENARKNGGFLIDFEINTARRFWGAKKVRGLSGIQFQILDD